MPKGESSFNWLFGNYKRKAKKRKIKFNLTKNQFRKLTQGNCYYCNKKPFLYHGDKKRNEKFLYNGVDRTNNDKGYFINNCTSCCRYCNQAKRQFSVKEFLNLIEKIYKNRIKNEAKKN